GRHPGPDAAVRALAMNQDTAISRCLFARRIRLLAPLVFHDQAIVAVLAFGGESAVHLAGYPDRSVHDRDDLRRIVVLTERLLLALGRRQPGIEVRQILAVEEVDDAVVPILCFVVGLAGPRGEAKGNEDQCQDEKPSHEWSPWSLEGGSRGHC